MDRRTFNRGIIAALIGIPAARLLAACNNNASGSSTVVFDLGPTTSNGPTIDAGNPAPGTVDLGTTAPDLGQPPTFDLAPTIGPPDLAIATFTYTSTIDAMHTHEVTIEASLYASPPSAGDMRMTTVDVGHSHVVKLTQAQIIAIANGTVLTIPTGVTNGHSHCFHFTNHP